MLETNRTLEYLGLAKLSLNDEDVEQIIDKIGKITFPTDQAEAHLAKIKQRDQIIEKNKKLKGKKGEEPVPILDNIEQVTRPNESGTGDVVEWVLMRNCQYKHINLCMNELTDEIMQSIGQLMRRTPDDFGITLSGNMIEKDLVRRLQEDLVEEHMSSKKSQDGSQSADPMIGLKRINF